MNIKPINDRVLIEETYEDNVTAAGIIIPDAAVEKPTMGIVKFVGKGGMVAGAFRDTQLKPGDKVLFGKYAGNEIKLEGKSYRMLIEEDVFAIVNEDQAAS